MRGICEGATVRAYSLAVRDLWNTPMQYRTDGVWGEKTMFGRKYMGVVRSTFLVDRDGKIARVWRNVRVSGHAEEVLESAKAL